MRASTRSIATCTGVAVGVVLAVLSAPASAEAEPQDREWAPAESATVYPGVKLFIGDGQCTANFVFTDDDHVYLGTAAHCSSSGSTAQSPTCDTASLPLGTEVEVQGPKGRRPWSTTRGAPCATSSNSTGTPASTTTSPCSASTPSTTTEPFDGSPLAALP